MTERKSSYLGGLSFANHYAATGAFKGNAGADFGAMLLLRNSQPFNGFAGTVSQFLCGTLQASSPSSTKGWALLWLAGPEPSGQLELLYGDSSLVQQTLAAAPQSPSPVAQRTMLVHVFLLRDPNVSPPTNVTALLYVNGALIARSIVSQTPADGTGVFRLGGASVNGVPIDAPGIGIAGFGYCNSIPGATLAAKLAAAQAMVDATVQESLETGDIADDALLSNLFSVRKALPEPRSVWVAQKGTVNLSRVGSSGLSVQASAPLFGDVPWPGTSTPQFGAASFDATTLGVHTLVPAPKAGKLRVASCQSAGPISVGWEVFSSDSSIDGKGVMATGVGNFDAQLLLGGAPFGVPLVGFAELTNTGGPFTGDSTLIIGPGEDVAVDIAQFHSGANRVFGSVSWYDIPADGCTIVRAALTDAPSDLMVEVPAGKVAIILDGSSTEWDFNNLSTRFFLEQLDTVLHHVHLLRDNGGGKVLEVSPPFNPPYQYFSPIIDGNGYPVNPLAPGAKLRAYLSEAVSTTPPKLHFAYRLVDLLP
jgi:hypothetical protein